MTGASHSLDSKLWHLFSLRRDGKGDLAIRQDFFTLMDRLGNPHRHLPPVIHVAGTNGKGSTIAFMRAMLAAAGYRVHVYTSPHLVRFHERIVLAGSMIDDATLETLLDEVSSAAEGLKLSFFELTPALGMLAFARHDADILLLETGLGGRLDHTNIVEKPLLSVITTLSMDHTHLLGDTIEKIAREKAGIMKPGVSCLAGRQIFPAALETLKDCAAAMDIPLIDETAWPRLIDPPAPNLTGAHQHHNAALAVAALRTQTLFDVPDAALRHGMTHAVWPARLQKIETVPLPPGWELWLDGGHNDSAALVLAAQAGAWQAEDGAPLYIITGMMGHKDCESFARTLAPAASGITAIAIPGHEEESTPPDHLAGTWQAYADCSVATAASLDAALHSITNTLPPGRILLTGSLYLAEFLL